ncbi:hypothetical protein ACJX0J_034946 [Zea mays]
MFFSHLPLLFPLLCDSRLVQVDISQNNIHMIMYTKKAMCDIQDNPLIAVVILEWISECLILGRPHLFDALSGAAAVMNFVFMDFVPAISFISNPCCNPNYGLEAHVMFFKELTLLKNAINHISNFKSEQILTFTNYSHVPIRLFFLFLFGMELTILSDTSKAAARASSIKEECDFAFSFLEASDSNLIAWVYMQNGDMLFIGHVFIGNNLFPDHAKNPHFYNTVVLDHYSFPFLPRNLSVYQIVLGTDLYQISIVQTINVRKQMKDTIESLFTFMIFLHMNYMNMFSKIHYCGS